MLDSPIGQLIRLKEALAGNMSRRAAYIAQDWLRQMPPDTLFADDPEAYKNLLQQTLTYPLIRQNQGISKHDDLAKAMVDLGMKQSGQRCTDFITHFIGIAEFLARDSRAGGAQ